MTHNGGFDINLSQTIIQENLFHKLFVDTECRQEDL